MYIIFKNKKSKRSHKARNPSWFFYYFCLVIEGFGSGSGSVTETNGSGSGSRRPKNMWIRIRIRNTEFKHRLWAKKYWLKRRISC